jgi:hypothetical protein
VREPSCAVVIPVRCASARRLAYFQACLASAAAQSEAVYCLVVDDGSPMASEVERAVLSRDWPIPPRYVRRAKPPLEAPTSAGALNLGFALALDEGPRSIEALCYLHSDDLLPRRSVGARLIAARAGGLAWGRTLVLREKDSTLNLWHENYVDPTRMRPEFTHHSAMWSRQVLEAAVRYSVRRYRATGVFDPSLAAYEDWEASITIAECLNGLSIQGTFVDEYVYYYREQSEGIAGQTPRPVARAAARSLLDKHGLEYSFVDPPWGALKKIGALRKAVARLPEPLKAPLKFARSAAKRILRGRRSRYSFPDALLADPLLRGYRPGLRP